ncbi:hypothetical protein [Sulfitobacter sp. CW3]|uniref:hypothetical protein n=1 Tax=Sulfitobacter sp. CW3 TaxID=2861965 RepID=UPI001C5F014F|nr:hypothetical protein [Sulfitobacter sp. CW3]MBW4964055.1 hypothetical protein [Sulfitobacter sp. CW3]
MAADPDPKKMWDVEAVRRLLTNAVRLKREDIVNACRIRIYELSGCNYEDPIERRLWQAVTAYEETLREKHGRKQQASYTRRKIASKGALQTLTEWALDPKVTPGFEALVAANAAKFTGEYVVVEYAYRFSAEAVLAAQLKLKAYGVEVIVS